MNSVFVEAKEWFDKTGGNSYFSARVEIDGKEVARLPFQYGYGSHYEYQALRELQEKELVPAEVRSLWGLTELGVSVYKTIKPALLRDVKAWGSNA